MFNVGGGEFLIIFLVALVVLGPQKLPDAARQLGKIAGEFRKISSGFQREMQSALNDPVSKVTGEPTPKSLTDVTKVAEVKPIDDAAPAASAETSPTEKKPASDPFGNKTTSSAAPVATPSVNPAADGPNGDEVVEKPAATDQRDEGPDETPDVSMFGDR